MTDWNDPEVWYAAYKKRYIYLMQHGKLNEDTMANRTNTKLTDMETPEELRDEGSLALPEDASSNQLNYHDADDGPQATVEHIETDTDYQDTGQGSSPAQALLDALKAPVNQEAVKSAISGLYLEAGVYKWVDGKCEVSPTLTEGDRKAWDISRAGRLVISVSGQVYHLESKRRGRFNFSYSPDKRIADSGEEDFMYQNHARLADFYLKKSGRMYRSQDELIGFLQQGMYGMNVSLSKRQQNFLRGFVA